MLPRLVLILLQLVLGYQGASFAMKYVPLSGDIRLIALVIVTSIIVWLVGFIGSEVLKETPRPGGATLTTTLVISAIAAALPLIVSFIDGVSIPGNIVPFLPVIGATLGYQMKRV